MLIYVNDSSLGAMSRPQIGCCPKNRCHWWIRSPVGALEEQDTIQRLALSAQGGVASAELRSIRVIVPNYMMVMTLVYDPMTLLDPTGSKTGSPVTQPQVMGIIFYGKMMIIRCKSLKIIPCSPNFFGDPVAPRLTPTVWRLRSTSPCAARIPARNGSNGLGSGNSEKNTKNPRKIHGNFW